MMYSQDILITSDPSIKRITEDLKLIGDMNLLIEGESGVGKTPIAKYANKILASKESHRPFVRLNCAMLSRERLQDEMFGHKKGAFTGADTDKLGHVELAQNGDLFLDEIAELDLHCQAELLIFLDSGEYRKMGDPNTRYSSCRIISATNRNLKNMVNEGTFRKDLYSRISQYKISIPPLRERKQDIQPIMEYYIKEHFKFLKKYSESILELLTKLDWEEGNIRQLRDAVTYMCYKSEGEEDIKISHINSELYTGGLSFNKISNDNETNNISNIDFSLDLKYKLEHLGFDYYMECIEQNILNELMKEKKSMRALAKKVKLSHTTLQRKLKKYGLSK